MSRPRFFKGPICGKDNCRSRYYYKADGQTFCRNNHLREGDVDYEIDDDEGLASGFGTRRKRGLQEHERSDPSERLVRVFGKAGYVLYLQALQCILKAQLQFLEARLHLTGVESLGKDLWEALLEAGNVQAQLPQDKHEDDRQSSSGVSDDNVQSSASENEVKGEPERKPPSRMYKSTRYTMHSPGLMHTFSICYLTLNLMRVPITIKVMHEWLVSGDLLFLHSRNILPDALFVRLEGRHHERLLPQSIPSVHRLWKWTSHTAQFLSLTSDIRFAPLNAPPVVLHFVKELLMPLDVLNAVLHLADTAPIDLSIYVKSRTQSILPRRLRGASPELRLLSTILIIAKLFYNLDGTKRSMNSTLEPPGRAPDLDLVQSLLRKRISAKLGVDVASKAKPEDVVNMTGQQMDFYLEYFAQQWVSERPVSAKTLKGMMPTAILNMFPIATGSQIGSNVEPAKPGEDEVAEAIKSLYSRTGPRHQSSRRPGQGYSLTLTEKPARHEIWDTLLVLASLVAGVEEETLRGHVRALELILAQRFQPPDLANRDVGRPRKRLRRGSLESSTSSSSG